MSLPESSFAVDQIQQEIVLIQQTIKELDHKVEACSAAGKYEEADKFQKKINAEKQKLAEKKKEQINVEQQEKQVQLQTAFTQMAMKFQNGWDDEVKNFEIECNALIEEVNHRHEEEMIALRETLEEEPHIPYKPSTELITLRTTEKQLAKLKNFKEATRAKNAADQLEHAERTRYEKEDTSRRESLVKQLEQQQLNEKTALLKKIERDRKEKSQQRDSDNARLEQRYRNLLRDQRTEQRKNTNQFEREMQIVRKKEDSMHITCANSALSRPMVSGSTGGRVSKPKITVKTDLNGSGGAGGSGGSGRKSAGNSTSNSPTPAAGTTAGATSPTPNSSRLSSSGSISSKSGSTPVKPSSPAAAKSSSRPSTNGASNE